MNVICYKRVSTEDQADRGYSLQHQEEVLRKYCEINQYNIVGMYTEDYSAKTFDRPEWRKIMAYVKKHKDTVDMILCLRWDRFSRNQYDALTTIKALDKLGVKVNTIEQKLDLSNPENKVLLSMYLTLPEVENDKNSIRTIDGTRRAKKEGCWTAKPPTGYDRYRDGKNATLRPNKDAPLITEAFERLATGAYIAEEVRIWLNSKGLKICKQTYLNIIRNHVYMGKIFIKPYKKEPAQIVRGLHPAIVSEEVFYLANDVLAGRKRDLKFHVDKTDIYPLKGWLKCPVHGTALTAYGSTGRKKTTYHYYLCTKCGHEQRHRIDDVHKAVEDVLSTIQVNAQTLGLYKKVLEKVFDKEDYMRRDETEKAKKEIDKMEQRKSNLQAKLLDGEMNAANFNEMMEKLEKDTAMLKNTLIGLQTEMTPFRKYIKHTLPMLENLVEYYKKADGNTKKKILGCIFTEKLIIEKGRVANTPFTIPVQVLLNTVKGFQGSKKKKEVEFDLLSTWAPLNAQSCIQTTFALQI